jgi:predicted amidophosphoribosyltransferase
MEMPFGDTLSVVGREALRIVLPAWCVVCARQLPWRNPTASCCAGCWESLPRIATPKCRSCAMPLVDDGLCLDCEPDPLPVDWCDAYGRYSGGLEQLLRAFKFGRHDFLDDAIVPVPMTRLREHRRGYNQAELLARALARRVGIRCELLLTTRGTRRTQSRLDAAARAANVRHAFTASRHAGGKRILLVDDVCTTGETLRASARALGEAGAARVCAITVAKTV